MRRSFVALLAAFVIAAPAAVAQTPSLVFQPLTPCRLLDTRLAADPLGGPALQPGVPRAFDIAGVCGIPAGALAVSVNATVTTTAALGQLVLYESDIAAPGTSNLSYGKGQTRASASIVRLAADGSFKALVVGGSADFILDVNGYFAVLNPPPPPTVTLDAVPDQTIPTNTTLSLRLGGHSTDAAAALTYDLVGGPGRASVSPLGVFAFSPNQAELGVDSVTVRVRDGGGRSAQRTFQITIVDHDHAPVLGPLPDDLTRVGQSYTKTLTATDPDAGDTLTFSLVSGPAGMTLTGATLSWTPTVTQLGNWPVRVKVTDHAGLSASGQFNVGIQFLVATDDAYSVTLGQILTVNAPGVLANDLDPLSGPLTAAKLTNPDKGTLNAFGADGSFTFTAPAVLPGPTFQPVLKWSNNNGAGSPSSNPLVADVFGNGKPVVFATHFTVEGGLLAIDGATGATLWAVDGSLPAPFTGCFLQSSTSTDAMAVGDIDDSGAPAVVMAAKCVADYTPFGSVTTRIVALDARTGSVKWLTAPLGAPIEGGGYYSMTNYVTPAIARLHPGETPSVLFKQDAEGFLDGASTQRACDQFQANSGLLLCTGVIALNGADGTVRQRFIAPNDNVGRENNRHGHVMVADLSGRGSGSPNVIANGAVWDSSGNLVSNRLGAAFKSLALARLDDSGQISIISHEESGVAFVVARHADGSVQWRAPIYSSTVWGQLSVADLDGDGRPEIMAIVEGELFVYDATGQIRWIHRYADAGDIRTIDESKRAAAFDLDGDGVAEVIVETRLGLEFTDGVTGNNKAILAWADMGVTDSDATGNVSAVVADVDGSGHASIVMMMPAHFIGAPQYVIAVGAQNNDWRPAPSVFNEFSYHAGNVDNAGHIPAIEPNNFAVPRTNVFGNQPQTLIPVDPRLKSQTSFTYTASDGALTSAPGTVKIDILPTNRPPAFVTSRPTRYVFGPFSYSSHAVDPDPGDTVTYSILLAIGNGANGCTIGAASGVLTCSSLNAGEQNIVLAATDTFGATGYQTLTLLMSAGPANVPNVVGQQQTDASTALVAAGFAVGDVTKVDNVAPAGEVIQQTPDGGASALLGSSVNLVVSKGPVVPPPPGPPPGLGNIQRIVVTPASTVHLTGENAPYKATSVNNDGTGDDITAFVTWSSSSAAVATVNAAGVAHAVGAGTTAITATVGGLSGQASISVATRTNGDNTPPVAILTQPASGGTVTGLTQILGTATDANFLRYELSLQASGDATFTTFSQGTTQVTNGVLGTLDPTLLLNGAYTLRLSVFDRNGNTTTADAPFVADGFQKVGNFTLAYTDLTVPLAGIPIQLLRLYDSRDKAPGDFGVGWSLGVKAVRLSASGIQGAGWQVVKPGLSFALVSASDHFVTVALPNGKVDTFDLKITPSVSPLVPFTTLFATFVPRPGSLGTLQSLENVNLLILDSQPGPVTLVDDTTLATFHPDRFLYTRFDGTQFVVTRTHGVESVTDTNGNQIIISPGGISHSSGAAVTFTRDGNGRITSITDPKGQTQTYSYTTGGDLSAHTDAAGATTSYFYNAQHGLVNIVDPLGRPAARADYDDQGRLISMTDAAGNTATYTHDLPGRREQAEDVLGHITFFNYDDRGNVLSKTDALGNTTVSTYDADDNETSRVDPDGLRADTTYNGVLPLTTVVDPGGLSLTTTNVYNGANDPTSITDPGGRVFSLTYDGNRNLTQVTTPLTGTATAAVNAQGLAISVTDGVGSTIVTTRDAQGHITRQDTLDAVSTLLRRTEFTYDANGNKLTQTLYRTVSGALAPLTTSYVYDAAGRNTSITDSGGGVSTLEYDALGQQTAVVDPLGRRTTYAYDDVGRNVSTTYPDGTSISAAFDAAGNVLSRTDQSGRTTTFAYDAVNRLVKTTLPDGSSTQVVYSPGGRVAATIDAKGDRTDYAYDAAGRRIGVTLPAVLDGVSGPMTNPQVSSVLNALGLPTTTTDPNGRQTLFQFDGAGHPVKTTFADGSFTTQTFDALGRKTSLTNEEGQTTNFTYDALGRLIGTSGLSGDATYTYDQADNLVAHTDALGRTTQFRYDVLNRQTMKTYPGGEAEQIAYDAVGHPVAITDANGKTKTVTYDVMGRPTRRDYFDASAVSFTYAPDGQRASATDARGVTIYGYDSVGRLASVVHPTGETVHYSRDPNGKLLSLSSPAATITYGYDALDRLVQVTGPEGVSRYFYDLGGNRVRLAAANGTTSDAVYDLRDRPTLLTHRNAGSTLLSSFSNVFSPAGRRSQVTELDGSQVQYTYDAKGRLASETRAGVTPLAITHAYDAVGNRTQTVQNGVTTNFAYDVDDRLLGDGTTTYAWDANGNLTSKTTGAFSTLYAWDPENHLASITDIGGTTQHAYDADGNRVRTTSPTGTTRFLVDGANNTGLSQVLEEKDGSGALQARYSYGNELLSMGRSGLASFFHTDAQGSTRTLTNAAGTPTDSYTFDALGKTVNMTGTTANAYLYGGQRFDAASGLYQLRARYYDPQLGRFNSRDPFGGRLEAPSSLHRFVYGGADPVNNADPTGLFSEFEEVFVAGVDETVEAAEFTVKFAAKCAAAETLNGVEDLAFAASVGVGILMATADLNAALSHKFNNGAGRVGSNLKTQAYLLDFENKRAKTGSLKRASLSLASAAGGIKISLEAAGALDVTARTFDFEFTTDPPSIKGTGGGKLKAYSKKFGCGPVAAGEIYTEFSIKGSAGASDAAGFSGGVAGEFSLKISLFGGRINASLPLLGFDFGGSQKKGAGLALSALGGTWY